MRARWVLAALVAACAGCDRPVPAPRPAPWRAPPQGPAAGQTAPSVDLYDSKGRRVRTRAWLGKEAALLVFGTTMCPNCKSQVAAIDAVRQKHAGKVEVAAVLLSETAERAEAFARDYHAGFPLLLDPQNSTMKPFALGNYPHYVLIDRKGVIRYTGPELPEDPALEEAAR
ncbi:MAG: TlpA family protein disulfide reductase [Planctomycetes bacterium]|nr:TlpA family protein disulfide reductase [Planctomycetota bacterium]